MFTSLRFRSRASRDMLAVSRSGLTLARGSYRLTESLSAVTFNRLCDVITPVFSRRLTVLLSRDRLPPLTAETFRSFSGKRKMPKKVKAVKAEPAAAAPTEASCPVSAGRGGAVTIVVRAKPGSKHSSITEVSAEAVGVAIAAPPTDGEANAELVRYLAEVLELKKSHVSLDKGSRSRDKVLRVDSSLSAEEVLQRLRQAAG